MTFSHLIGGTAAGSNKNRGKGPVHRIIVHHQASANRGGENHLTNPTTKVSANYILRSDGTLIGQVPEEYRPWTTGPTPDANSITIEIQNSTGAPTWKVSAAAKEKLARLMADLSIRYGWGPLKLGTNVRMHREFKNTNCPGPDMEASLPAIVENANKIRKGDINSIYGMMATHTVLKSETLSSIAKKHGTTWQKIQELNKLPNPDSIKPGQKLVVRSSTSSSTSSARDIALEVYQGKWGNGDDRVRRLKAAGYNPSAVQAEVNRRWY